MTQQMKRNQQLLQTLINRLASELDKSFSLFFQERPWLENHGKAIPPIFIPERKENTKMIDALATEIQKVLSTQTAPPEKSV